MKIDNREITPKEYWIFRCPCCDEVARVEEYDIGCECITCDCCNTVFEVLGDDF